MQRILTGDESRVHHYDSECKAQSMEYRHKTSPSPKKFKVVASARKVLFTVSWDMEGVVHMEFLEQGQTVNSERYISTLGALKLRLRRIRRDKDSILQHDNARPHTSRQTQVALRQLELTTLPHAAYSPELAPSDYYLFSQLKKYLKGHHYDNDEETIADVRRWCRGQLSEFFTDGERQLVKRWGLCVDRDGDYVDKKSAKYGLKDISIVDAVLVFLPLQNKIITDKTYIDRSPSWTSHLIQLGLSAQALKLNRKSNEPVSRQARVTVHPRAPSGIGQSCRYGRSIDLLLRPLMSWIMYLRSLIDLAILVYFPNTWGIGGSGRVN
ncbi:transposase [Plakobranchus ocellatus]|uniref:Transposase n=1 Tax=Plakobranchus ocellatus TaxID=259542 RepID=A0AAV3YEF6_9GAST|nr:transposase [Plakobranchus ocellatus]